MNKRYVLDAAGVEAVNRAISRVGNTPPAMLDTNRRHRITVTEGGGDSGYNGYFKIIDASITDDNGKTVNKIRIVDGATYDAGAGVSGVSICKVNNKVFYIEMFSADVSEDKTYCLKYTAATEASGETPAAAAKVEIVELDAMPSDDAQTAYYQIGRTIIKDGTMKIAQDHTAGVAQIYWYLLCSEDEAKG